MFPLKNLACKGLSSQCDGNGLAQCCVVSSVLATEQGGSNLMAFPDIGQWGPCNPYKPCNYDLYIGIIIFPHKDNP